MVSFVISLVFIITGSILGNYFLKNKSKIAQGGKLAMGGFGFVAVGGIIFISSILFVIDAGEIGIGVTFGSVGKQIYHNGVNFKAPWMDVVIYPVRIREHSQGGSSMLEARSKDGLIVGIDCTVFFSVNEEQAVYVYQKIATSVESLEENIMVPSLRTIVRNVISKYDVEEIMSSKREEVISNCEITLRNDITPMGIVLSKFMIRGIKLPESVDEAIQMKMKSQQESEAMLYQKQKAQQQAEIKIIEAQGLARAQSIINQSLTPLYIQHEAIQAYEKLAGSPNTTFVFIPTSPSGGGVPVVWGSGFGKQ